MDKDDDPTRALDDFVSRMRPPRPDLSPPDLSDLLGKLATERPSPAATPARGGRLRSGETWRADDVVDVPHIEVPSVAPADLRLPELSLPTVEGLPPDTDWQPDQAALTPQARVADARLLSAWKSGAWTGAIRQVMDAVAEVVNTPGGTAVETYPPQRLLALWPPHRDDQPLLGRWPAAVQLCALGADEAAEQLLAAMPADAELWLTRQELDWALVAELLLHHDESLRPFQLKGLRAFVESEREASFARLNAGYHQATPGGAVTPRD